MVLYFFDKLKILLSFVNLDDFWIWFDHQNLVRCVNINPQYLFLKLYRVNNFEIFAKDIISHCPFIFNYLVDIVLMSNYEVLIMFSNVCLVIDDCF